MAFSGATLADHTSLHREFEAGWRAARNAGAVEAAREIAEWLRQVKDLPALADELEAEFITAEAEPKAQ